MIPVCALIKCTDRGQVRRIQIFIDGLMAYSYPGNRDQIAQLRNLMNDLWSRVKGRPVLHIDVDYDIEEPPLC